MYDNDDEFDWSAGHGGTPMSTIEKGLAAFLLVLSLTAIAYAVLVHP